MAKKGEQRVFSVSVVGLSGTEKEKGQTGIGKSCLCNRFMHPHADEYYTDHISVIGQSDFGGRVINNDHFLYWGEATKTSDDGVDFTFQVVEQTEFIDDSSFLPFKIGKTEPYFKRCAATKLTSAEKLMYICKNQLGVENDYTQKLLPEGKLSVDGFLCLFDVSIVKDRTIEALIEYTGLVLSNLIKTKKPVVLVTTKNDEAHELFIKEAEKLANRKEFKGALHLVETSAHENINVELAFLTLGHLIDRTKGRPKIVPFSEAAQAKQELIKVAKEAYQNLIRSQVTDFRTTWSTQYRRFQQHPDYLHYVELKGTEEARRLFRQHTKQLREEYIQHRKNQYLESLQIIIEDFLPDLTTIADRSWPSCVRMIRRRDDFLRYFVVLPENVSWQDSEFLDSTEEGIPADILESSEAETLFRNHVNGLRAEQKRLEWKKNFRQLLQDNCHVTPGKPLKEVSIFFLGRDAYSSLCDDDKMDVYDSHQRELRDRAKREFLELMCEHSDLFDPETTYANFSSTDLAGIKSKLEGEPRYKALDRLDSDRHIMLLNYVCFLQRPTWDKCPFLDNCVERRVQKILTSKAHRPQSWNKDSQFVLDAADHKINMVLLGGDGLADEMVREIRSQCIDDDFSMDSAVYSLDYRPIDGDVSLPHNALCSADFLPHGCFCIYNSFDSLYYIHSSLDKTLLSDLQAEDRLPFQGLPIVLVLAWDPELTDQDLELLRAEGRSLAERLQCPFIDIPSSQMTDDKDQRFHKDQVTLAVRALVDSIQYRSTFTNPWHIAESIEPDIRVLMCMNCGDNYNMEVPLLPLLNHQCCYVTSDRFPAITLETYLGGANLKVEIIIVSYHGANVVRNELFHGYILVYHTRRKASLASLRTLTRHIPLVPTHIIAATDHGPYPTELSQRLLAEGQAVAENINASFWTTGHDCHGDSSLYTPFFRAILDNKDRTEQNFGFSRDELNQSQEQVVPDSMSMRPPAALPKQHDPYRVKSSSNSQSTEDSEPLYDRLRFEADHSDSEMERASSTSPTPLPLDVQPYQIDAEVYSEIAPHNGDREQLIKRSPMSLRKGLHSDQSDHTEWTDPGYYNTFSSDRKITPPSKPKSRPKGLDFNRLADIITRPLTQPRGRKHSDQLPLTSKAAPLATPEKVEIVGDYAVVKDALSPEENDYASVHNALPAGRLHRIKSTFRKKPKGDKGGTDSDSEFSSLEREGGRDTLYDRVGRKPTPHKKKHKHQRSSDSGIQSTPPSQALNNSEDLQVYSDPVDRIRSNSPSEGSEGTGDEFAGVKKVKKRRSFRSKKKKQFDPEASYISPPFSDTDAACAPLLPKGSIDDGHVYESVIPKDGTKYEDGEDDLDGSGNWWRGMLGLRKKEDKKKVKDEEKKQQKLQRKLKKKAGSVSTASQSSNALEDLATSDENPLPPLVVKCVDFIEQEGTDSEGLYRVSGSKTQADALIEILREDPDFEIRSLDIPVSAAATALKTFFAELPEPLIPNHLYEQLIEALGLGISRKRRKSLKDIISPSSEKNQSSQNSSGRSGMRPRSRSFSSMEGVQEKSNRLLLLRGILRKLPSVNYEVLKYLITHLHNVKQHSHVTKMDSGNLGKVWWPTLFRPDIPSIDKVSVIGRQLEDVVQLMIDQCGFLFYDENEV